MSSTLTSFSDALKLLNSEIHYVGDARLEIIQEITTFFTLTVGDKILHHYNEAMSVLVEEEKHSRLLNTPPRKFMLRRAYNLLCLANKTRLLRTTSFGLDGTLANMEHHASVVEPLVAILISHFVTLQPEIKKWVQGHNIHIITAMDDRMLSFRPFADETGIVGIQVSAKMSRSLETRLQFIESEIEAIQFGSWLAMFLDVQQNLYGVKKTSGKE